MINENYRTFLQSIAKHSGINRAVCEKYGHCPIYLTPAVLRDARKIFAGVQPKQIYTACTRALLLCAKTPIDGFSVKFIDKHLTLKIET